MSMPHECTCRICGGLMSPQFLGLNHDREREQRSIGARALTSAIMKIAPVEAKAIAERWQAISKDESDALEEFLTFLRQHSVPQNSSPIKET